MFKIKFGARRVSELFCLVRWPTTILHANFLGAAKMAPTFQLSASASISVRAGAPKVTLGAVRCVCACKRSCARMAHVSATTNP